MPFVMPLFQPKINPDPKNYFERLNNSFLRRLQTLDSSDSIFRRMLTNNLTQEKISQIIDIIELSKKMRGVIHDLHLRAEGIMVGNDDISVGGDSCLSNIYARLHRESVEIRGILPIISVDSRFSIMEFIRTADISSTRVDLEEIADNLREAHNFLCIAIRLFAENARNDRVNEKQESSNYVLTLMNIIIELENKALMNAKLSDQHAIQSRLAIELRSSLRSSLGRGYIEEYERQMIEEQRQRFADEALRREREAEAAEQQRLADEALRHAPPPNVLLSPRAQGVTQPQQLGGAAEADAIRVWNEYQRDLEHISRAPIRAIVRAAQIVALNNRYGGAPPPDPASLLPPNNGTRLSRP